MAAFEFKQISALEKVRIADKPEFKEISERHCCAPNILITENGQESYLSGSQSLSISASSWRC